MKRLIHTPHIPKFNHKEFGAGKNPKSDDLIPCKIFLNKKGKAVIIPKEKK